MLKFNKGLLTLSVASLTFAGMAFGQASIPTATTAGASTPVFAAIEGVTELLPPVTFTLAGTVTGSIQFTLTSNVPITNVLQPAAGPTVDIIAQDNNGDLGTATITGPTTIQITFPTVTAGLTSITVYNIRANASLSTSPTITLTPSSAPASGIAFTGAGAGAVTEAFVVKSLLTPTFTTFANTSLALTAPNVPFNVVSVTITGAFSNALKTIAAYTGQTVVSIPAPPVAPAVLPAAGPTPPAPIAALQGTRLALSFTNLNSNVNYFVPTTASGGGVTLTAYNAATGNTAATAATVTATNGVPAASVLLPAPVGGVSTIYYGVTAGPGLGPVIVTLQGMVPSQAAVTSVQTVGVGVSIVLVGVSTGYPQFSATQTPFAASQTVAAGTNGLLTLNTTTLLFPYVINIAGYDTGIAITNATAGLSATGTFSATATGTAGTASVFFFGTGVPTPNPLVLPVIAGGTESPFLISQVAPGFNGYLVVTANFSNAHGFAFVADGFGGGGRGLSQGYLAIVTNSASLPGVPASGATTPTF